MNSPESVPNPCLEGRIHISDNADALARDAAARIWALGRRAVEARGRFCIALAGGSTPRILYRTLAATVPAHWSWADVQVFFGDERDVPPDHPDSNARMARETLLDQIPIPAQNVHPMRSADASLRRDAARYAAVLRRLVPSSEDGWPQLDLILLGLGSDGHIASLFPGTCVLHERQLSVAAVHVPQQRSWRLSLTLPVLERARHLLFLVAGADKSRVLAAARAGPGSAGSLPVHRLQPRGEVEWFCDRAAAAHLTELDPPRKSS